MSYSKDPYTSIAAFRSLEAYFTRDDPVIPSVTGSYYPNQKKLIEESENYYFSWIPSYSDILEVLKSYGASFSSSSIVIQRSNSSKTYEYLKVKNTPTSNPINCKFYIKIFSLFSISIIKYSFIIRIITDLCFYLS